MALYKPITQDDGVVTNYHRILYIQSMINSHVSIVVLSYVSNESRATESASVIPYKHGVTYQTDYIENMTIAEAYSYLKTLDVFAGAEDIFEKGEEEIIQNGN